ncbi:MAG: conserved phage C-terminal domain-containing protein [Clostridioides sp.]|jgi:hypothetical protein|nr:conserved phage C-terminal domain-containing protein [Clostridioides sp.]
MLLTSKQLKLRIKSGVSINKFLKVIEIKLRKWVSDEKKEDVYFISDTAYDN